MKRSRTTHRRGITLLFVISMIVLFLLMGTAFVVVSNDFFRQSRRSALANIPEITESQQSAQLVEQAFFELVRGPDLDNVESPLRAHDLLGDQYGFGFSAFVANTPASVAPNFVGGSNDLLIEIAVTSQRGTAADNLAFSLLDGTGAGAQNLPTFGGSLGGQVISITSGALKGFSTRITSDRVDIVGGNPVNIIQFPARSIAGLAITTPADLTSLANAEIIVNGRDFGGTGPAFMPAAGGTRAQLADEALRPNRQGQTRADLISGANSYLSSFDPVTAAFQSSTLSVNEPWDAADYNNMFLAGFDATGDLIPSFHRQSMVANSGVSNQPNRRNFFYAFDVGGDGMPDVDLTGDGQADSFWMDTGFSIQTDSAGRRFKPLVAYHVVDLDGRLNLNAHGNLTHVRLDTSTGNFVEDAFINVEKLPAGGIGTRPRGQGWGPPEVNLIQALGGSNQQSLGVYQRLLQTRYGADGVPGVLGGGSFRSQAKLFGHPFNTLPGNNAAGTVGRLFGTSPMDLHGRFRIGTAGNSFIDTDLDGVADSALDNFADPNFANVNGMPEIDMQTSLFPGTEFTNSPYEFSLTSDSAGDAPFSAAELERLLRPNDIDSAGLPDRLWQLPAVANFWTNPARAGAFTTDSYEVPLIPQNIVSLLRNQIADVFNVPEFDAILGTPATQQEINDEINRRSQTLLAITGQFALARELSAGLKMDINRPLGDGNDNDGDNVVDEPGEVAVNSDAAGVFGSNQGMELTNGRVNFDPMDNPRVIFARQLYVLAMLLMEPPNADLDGDGTVDAMDQLEFARMIAQWSVNVVDFRDPDSINTRFEYDPFPFDINGFNPDDMTSTTDGAAGMADRSNVRVVWGCERPELLLTETLAGHVRNTEDLDTDPNNPFQQRLRPEPFAYFEVYNPWVQNRLNQRLDPSLYSGNGFDDGTDGVAIGRINGDGSPVWRFELERIDTTGAKPLRYVYMADPTGASITYNDTAQNQVPADIEIFFPNANSTAVVRPGSQVVIGTQGFEDPNDANSFRTFIGRRSDVIGTMAAPPTNLMLDQTQHLAFDANAGQITRQFFDPDPVDPMINPPVQVSATRSAAVVFIDRSVPATGGAAVGRKFSLSDPFGGYESLGNPAPMDIPDGDGAIYTPPLTQPLDRITNTDINRDAQDLAKIVIGDGTSKDFRTVRLQRLANPLVAWDPLTNPYLTIDSMEVDLVVCNGATAAMEPGLANAMSDGAVSLERGANDQQGRLLWSMQRNSAVATGTPGQGNHFFDQELVESLGGTNLSYQNNPAMPFPWLTWNNRPFVSHMEVMNVPFVAADQLTYRPELDMNSPLFTVDTLPQPFTTARGPGNGSPVAGRFGHLLNFFGSDDPTTGNNNFAEAYRLLDYIEVPSRFVGTEDFFLETTAAPHPFNFISRYRVPGKINLNTIPPMAGAANSVVWETLNAEFATSSANWMQFLASRNGTAGTLPTDFENPFRPYHAASFTPGSIPNLFGSNVTLLRQQVAMDPISPPLFDFNSTNASEDSQRSAYFRNSMRTRLANLTTNRSSVFAIWVTVGYFEVDQNGALVDTGGKPLDVDGNPMTPSTPGVGTVAEVGAIEGTAVRNRAFYIFDRSIPVAYEPGQNHNIDQAIMVKSIIE